jgi:hypothetical protein
MQAYCREASSMCHKKFMWVAFFQTRKCAVVTKWARVLRIHGVAEASPAAATSHIKAMSTRHTHAHTIYIIHITLVILLILSLSL